MRFDSVSGKVGDKNYMRLMETLEVLILELDGIGVDGQESVRTARRAAVREIQQAIEMLEFRSSTHESEETGSIVQPADKPSPEQLSSLKEGNT